MTDDLHALILVPARAQYPECPRYDEIVIDWDLAALGALFLGAMVAIVWRRRWV